MAPGGPDADRVDVMVHATTPAPQHRTTGLEWEAVDLLLNDDLLVRELFEQIVEAEWPPAPQVPSVHPPEETDSVGGVEASGPPAHRTRPTALRRHRHVGADRWARERSPPADPQQLKHPTLQRIRWR